VVTLSMSCTALQAPWWFWRCREGVVRVSCGKCARVEWTRGRCSFGVPVHSTTTKTEFYVLTLELSSCLFMIDTSVFHSWLRRVSRNSSG
jgi:hypothetical protein